MEVADLVVTGRQPEVVPEVDAAGGEILIYTLAV
jgi:hypothetical protein